MWQGRLWQHRHSLRIGIFPAGGPPADPSEVGEQLERVANDIHGRCVGFGNRHRHFPEREAPALDEMERGAEAEDDADAESRAADSEGQGVVLQLSRKGRFE